MKMRSKSNQAAKKIPSITQEVIGGMYCVYGF
jgi:hypothetical protein